jgi:transcriptional regulator with XRE-family HTH domain
VVRLSRLKAWRERRALTQQELADKIGITRVALARIESGQAQPRPRTTRALAKALDVPIDALMEPLDA